MKIVHNLVELQLQIDKAWHCSTVHNIHELTAKVFVPPTPSNAHVSYHHNFITSSSKKNVCTKKNLAIDHDNKRRKIVVQEREQEEN